MSIMVVSDYNDLLSVEAAGVTIVQAVKEAFRRYWPEWLNIRYSTKKSEKTQQVDSIGLAEEKGAGQPMTPKALKMGYARETTNSTWALMVEIVEELIEDAEFLLMLDVFQKMAEGYAGAQELRAAWPINYMFNTGAAYLGSDSKPLSATDHPSKDGATTWSNKLSAIDFCQSQFEAADVMARTTTDSDGSPRAWEVTKVLVHPTNRVRAEQVAKSTMQTVHGPLAGGSVITKEVQTDGSTGFALPTTNVNVFAGTFSVVSLPWMTATNDYAFLGDRHGVFMQIRKEEESVPDACDVSDWAVAVR